MLSVRIETDSMHGAQTASLTFRGIPSLLGVAVNVWGQTKDLAEVHGHISYMLSTGLTKKRYRFCR